MKKIAIFAEGQSESIFTRYLLGNIFDYNLISFECLKLHAGNFQPVPFKYNNPNANLHFLIINVQGDGNVVSAIKEREKKLIDDGYDRIIGLRDMYSEEYDKHSGGCIKPEITKKFIDGHNIIVSQMSSPKKIYICFSIMEIEAWFLSINNIFERIHSSLTIEFINQNLNIDISKINPEEIFHPANIIKNIYQLCGMKYDKSENDIENIVSKISIEDILDSLDKVKCSSFNSFFELLNVS